MGGSGLPKITLIAHAREEAIVGALEPFEDVLEHDVGICLADAYCFSCHDQVGFS